MLIRGSNPATNIAFTCQGINGCISTLQNVNRNLDTERKRIDAFKSDYVLKANQNVDQFTKQMAAMLSPQSQQLQNQLKAMNTALASLGVGQGINIKPVDGEQLEKDDDGLYKAPKNALNLIGANMNPPMLDVNGDAFTSGLGGIAEGQKDVDHELARAQTGLTKLNSLASSCSIKPVRDLVASLSSDVGNISDCGTNRNCDPGSRLYQLADSMRSLTGPGIDPGVTQNLSTSIANACAFVGTPSDLGPVSTSGVSTSAVGEENRRKARCEQIFSNLEGKVQQIKSRQGDAMGNAGIAN
jgi:hypothetical protein